MLFDTFGTAVDWRGSVIHELSQLGAVNGLSADWAPFADRWLGRYQPQMDCVCSGARPWIKLDDMHREVLDALLLEFGIAGLDEAQRRHLNNAGHRLDPRPDSVVGLKRLNRRCIIGPLSSANVALLTNLAKHAGLPRDVILASEPTPSHQLQP